MLRIVHTVVTLLEEKVSHFSNIEIKVPRNVDIFRLGNVVWTFNLSFQMMISTDQTNVYLIPDIKV